MFEIIGYDYTVEKHLYFYNTDDKSIGKINILKELLSMPYSFTVTDFKLRDGIKNLRATKLDNGLSVIIFSLCCIERDEESWLKFYCILNDWSYDLVYNCLNDTLKTGVKLKLLGKNNEPFDELDYFTKCLRQDAKKGNFGVLRDPIQINGEECIFISLVNLTYLSDLFCDKTFGIPRSILSFMIDFKNYCIEHKKYTGCNQVMEMIEIASRPVYDYTRNRLISVEKYIRELANADSKSVVQFYGYQEDEDSLYTVIKGVFDWNYGTGYKIVRYSFKDGTFSSKLEQLYGFDLDKFIRDKDLNVFVRDMEGK